MTGLMWRSSNHGSRRNCDSSTEESSYRSGFLKIKHMRTKKLLTIKQHRALHKTDKEASLNLQVGYITYRRWLNEEVYSPEGSAWRRCMADCGIDLPRKEKVK